MGAPVVHFEIVGQDWEKLTNYYSELFGWTFDTENPSPLRYGVVKPDSTSGIGGGLGSAPEGYPGHVTFYVGVPDVEASLAKAESMGGTRMMGPDKMSEDLEIGLFTDPEGHTIGLVRI